MSRSIRSKPMAGVEHFALVVLVGALAVALAGCNTTQSAQPAQTTAAPAVAAAGGGADRPSALAWAGRYPAHPNDPQTVVKYAPALRIVPDEPSVLSNLGLSYALSKDLVRAEATLRRAAVQSRVDSRVQENLALVMDLQGRAAGAGGLARADLPAAEANVAYLRQVMAQQNGWKAQPESEKPVLRAEGS